MYAGPVGFFGGEESEFAVGIRSALVEKVRILFALKEHFPKFKQTWLNRFFWIVTGSWGIDLCGDRDCSWKQPNLRVEWAWSKDISGSSCLQNCYLTLRFLCFCIHLCGCFLQFTKSIESEATTTTLQPINWRWVTTFVFLCIIWEWGYNRESVCICLRCK